MKPRRFSIGIVLVGLALAGCGSSSKSGTSTSTSSAGAKVRPKVTITAQDYAFALPAKMPAGYVDVTLINSGKEDHHAQLVKLDSMTFGQFKAAALETDVGALNADTIFVGGPNGVAPGGSVTTTVKLDPGAYAVVCFIPGTDGKPHATKGMIGEFQVAETSESSNTAPTADSTITLGDFSFTLPPGYTGKGLTDVSNQGTQVHEMIVLAEAPGATFAQVKKYLSSPTPPTGAPPAKSVGGTVGLSSQQHAWLNLNLERGKYVLVCFFPDTQKGGLPHAFEGMLKEITIP